MHKGYTLNYFINFFKNIPDHRWTEGVLAEGAVRRCALGHCRTDQRTGYLVAFNKTAKSEALQYFLGGQTVHINDGLGDYSALGRTPRGRVLKALRNRKRYGSVWPDSET